MRIECGLDMNIMPKNYKKQIKFYVTILVSYLIILVIGSFYPNPYTKFKLRVESEKFYTNWANNLGLQEPSFEYSNDKQFVAAVRKCVDWVNFETPRAERVPIEMVVAMAALESGWGTSRFSKEGDNLFGIRTYDKKVPHMLLEGRKTWKGWGVRKFTSKCQGVKFFIELLNNHNAYEQFREARRKMVLWNKPLDPSILVKTLKNYSTTTDYADRVINIIEKLRKET